MKEQTTTVRLPAWRVEINGMEGVAFAATNAKAKWQCVKSYWDAYGRNGWPNPVAVRAPQYDKSLLALRGPKAWCESYVRDYPWVGDERKSAQ